MKNVLVLGASGDIGGAICKQLAEEGYSLILHYFKNENSMRTLVKQLEEEAVLQIIQADLTSDEGAKDLCESVMFDVHAIVYVSGTAHIGLFQDTKESEMDQMLHLHVRSPWLVTQYFLPNMIVKGNGKIVFITSIWGNVGASNEVIYSSVKGAQNSFVRALAKEVGPSGISVNAVSPGFIDTKMNQHLAAAEREDIIAHIPVNRAGMVEDVAHAVSFLMDEKSTYIQGEILNISGGWS